MTAARYRHYLLNLLMVILAFNYVDRLALGLVLQNIKTDLHLSDTQLGALSGIAFALFYAVMGLPIARWADRGNRVTIVTMTLALWSVTVALCGAVRTFPQLVIARIAAAVGEAGCIPAAHSLIPDYFDRAERPRAVARYVMGAPLSCIIGFLLAGWLNELYGWRNMFVILSLPGFLLTILAWRTLKDPRERSAPAVLPSASPATQEQPAGQADVGLIEVGSALFTNTTFRHLVLYFSVVSFFNYGIVNWQPAFLVRSFGLGTGELGTWFTLIYGLGVLVGTYLGGEWAARSLPNRENLQLRAGAFMVAAFGVISPFIYLSDRLYVTLTLLAVANVGIATLTGPLFATIQTLIPQHRRATSIAILYLFGNLIGLGLGPLATGALSDGLRSWAGAESLRYALLILCPGFFWGAWHLWRASQTVVRDIADTATDGNP